MAGLPASLDAGKKLRELYSYLEMCSGEVDGCEFCSMQQECNDYCDTHLYNKSELKQDEFLERMANITRRWKSRRKLVAPAARECSIEFPKVRHQGSSLICAGGGF
jgi:hypothetical protein